jgi:hypothetical protein
MQQAIYRFISNGLWIRELYIPEERTSRHHDGAELLYVMIEILSCHHADLQVSEL